VQRLQQRVHQIALLWVGFRVRKGRRAAGGKGSSIAALFVGAAAAGTALAHVGGTNVL